MKKKHAILALVAALALVAVIIGAALSARPKPKAPSPTVMSPEEKVKFIASDKFKGLSQEQQAQFLRQSMRQGPGELFKADQSLTDAERDKLRQNMRAAMEERHKQEADAYFALPESERDAYLDSVVKEMAARRPPGPPPNANAKGQNGPPPGGGPDGKGGPGGPGGGFSHFKERVDSTDPVTRAKEMEYRKAVMKKMIASGVRMGPPPR